MNIIQYLRDSREELQRVSWPTRSQMIEGTQAALLFIVGFTLIVYILDVVFGTIIRAVI